MVTGWRKAFCTSMTMPKVLTENHQQHWDCDNTNQSPRISSEFTFASTPPIPQSMPSPNLRCRTSVSNSSLPNSPKLHCNTPNKHNSPRLFNLSNPSSPNSPSTYYSLLKATLRLSKSLCGICTQSVKTGEGKAIFTAECSHIFHFPCIAAHVKNQQTLTCPVCGAHWNKLQPEKTAEENRALDLKTTKSLKLHNYDDDEPLLSPTSVSRFNPIPESDENEEEDDEENKEPIEFQGFNVSSSLKTRIFDACLLPEAAIVASNRSFETLVTVLKMKAPPCNAVAHRPPVDLVTVLDVGGTVSAEELWMLKRSMQVVISSLGSADRLSVVAFSGGSKRLFPLRRMTGRGRRAARRIVDALAVTERSRDGGPARDNAVKKAAKVLEDRRQKNPVAKIMLLSNGHEDQRLSSSRFSHLEFPVHALSYGHAHQDGAFSERVRSFLHVVAHDLRLELHLATRSSPAEITAVYSPSASLTTALSPNSAVLGDLHAAEERELLVELKVPAGTGSRGSHYHVLSVRSSHRDPFTQDLVGSKERAIIVPRPHAVRSSDPKIQWLMRFHVSGRAVAESRRLWVQNDVSGAHHVLSSARASMSQSSHESTDEWLRWLEAEEAELQRRVQSQTLRTKNDLEEKLEPLMPMSAWKTAERLAKVAIMKKSLNKVSDLHGFESARF